MKKRDAKPAAFWNVVFGSSILVSILGIILGGASLFYTPIQHMQHVSSAQQTIQTSIVDGNPTGNPTGDPLCCTSPSQ